MRDAAGRAGRREKGVFGIDHDLPFDATDDVDFGDGAAQNVQNRFGFDAVAGPNRMVKTRFLDFGEIRQGARRVARHQNQHARDLRHRFEQ